MIFPVAVATISTWPRQAQANASTNSAMTVAPIARPVGDGGVSTISSAAGRNASSSRSRRLAGKGTTFFSGVMKPAYKHDKVSRTSTLQYTMPPINRNDYQVTFTPGEPYCAGRRVPPGEPSGGSRIAPAGGSTRVTEMGKCRRNSERFMGAAPLQQGLDTRAAPGGVRRSLFLESVSAD